MGIKPINLPQPASKPAKPLSTPLSSKPVVTLGPKVVKRVTQPNLTGFYEHVPVKGKDSAILVQNDQAIPNIT